MDQEIDIAAITPFWRYALVGSSLGPGIPFWSLSEAESAFHDMMMEFPLIDHHLYKRTWTKGLVLILKYDHKQNKIIRLL